MTERFECPNCGGRLWERVWDRTSRDAKDTAGKPVRTFTGPLVCAVCTKAEHDIALGYRRGTPCHG